MKKLAVVLVLLAVVAAVGYGPFRRRQMGKPFEDKLKEYEYLSQPAPPGGARDGTVPWNDGRIAPAGGAALPYRSGKVFVVKQRKDPGKGGYIFEEDRVPQIDPAWYELDGSMRASTPAECDTLIQTYHDVEETQGYVDAGAPVRTAPGNPHVTEFNLKAVLGTRTVTVKIVDLKNKVTVGTWKLYGPKPPETLKKEDIDKLPYPPLAAFLKAMPVR